MLNSDLSVVALDRCLAVLGKLSAHKFFDHKPSLPSSTAVYPVVVYIKVSGSGNVSLACC